MRNVFDACSTADPLRGQVGGGWALEIVSFLGSLKWYRANRRVQFEAQKTRTHQKSLRTLLMYGLQQAFFIERGLHSIRDT